MLHKGGVNSGPDSHGVPDGVWTERPGFSLCATPLELSGPGFQDGRVDGMNERRSEVYRVIVGDICSFVWVIKREFMFFTDALQYGLYARVWALR